MKGCPTARSQPAVNPCLHLHISGKCLQADPYQRPRYPELKCVIELPTSAPVTLEVLLQAQRVPVLRSCHKTTEWLASKGRAGIEGSHHKWDPLCFAPSFLQLRWWQGAVYRPDPPEPVRRVATSSGLRAPPRYENRPSQMTNQRCVCNLSVGAYTSTFKEKWRRQRPDLHTGLPSSPSSSTIWKGYFWRKIFGKRTFLLLNEAEIEMLLLHT